MKKLSLFFLLCFFMSQQSYALRCGTQLIQEGDQKYKVLELCGEPVSAQKRTIYRKKTYRTSQYINSKSSPYLTVPASELSRNTHSYDTVVEVEIEEWVYNFGPNRLLRELWFENGEIIKITPLSYGF